MPSDSQDMYDDGPAAPAANAGDKPAAKEGDEDRKTFIVPKFAFGGRDIKPGDKCDIEVCMVHENDVECYPCEPGEHDEEHEKPSEDATPPPAATTGGMSSMME